MPSADVPSKPVASPAKKAGGPKPPEMHEGIDLKDKSLAGVKPREIKQYSPKELAELAAKSKYKNLKALRPEYHGETRGQGHFRANTKYLKEAGREQFELKIEGGKIKQRGAALETGSMQSWSAHNPLVYIEEQGRWATTTGAAMYVLDPDGTFYATGQTLGRVQHSSLIAGGPVASAGHMKIEDGTLTYLDNNSGHYRAGPEHLWQALEELASQGIPPSSYDIAVTYESTQGETAAKRLPKPEGETFLEKAKAHKLDEILPYVAPEGGASTKKRYIG
jgi:hypothetical protein